MKWRRCRATPAAASPASPPVARAAIAPVILSIAALLFAAADRTMAAPARATLVSADVSIALQPDGVCRVEMQLGLDLPAAGAIEHRLAVSDGTTVDDLAVSGAGLAGTPQTVGRTMALPISFTGTGRQSYALRYRAAQPGSRPGRCPLFLPLAPTDGLARSVTLQVAVPSDAGRLPGDFPAFVWDEAGRGRATLGHLPAFVLVPIQTPGQAIAWLDRFDTRRLVDIAAIAILVGASGIWALARRRPA